MSTDDPAEQPPDAERSDAGDRAAAAARIRFQQSWVDLQVRLAQERGEFDDLPGAGKPLDLSDAGDPDWWLKRMIAREQITGVAPEAILLRKDDALLDQRLDRQTAEQEVRRMVEEFNRRVIEARRQLQGGPPVLTSTRDADDEVRRWRDRRAQARAAHNTPTTPQARQRQRRWWPRRGRS